MLISDLENVYFDNPQSKIKLGDIDYMIVSGDFVDSRYEQEPMTKAFNFISIVSSKLKIPFEKNNYSI